MSTTSKKLIVVGNSLALVLDKPILEATGIDRDTPLESRTNGDVIMISHVRATERTAELAPDRRRARERNARR
jgi:antitoxin MazE